METYDGFHGGCNQLLRFIGPPQVTGTGVLDGPRSTNTLELRDHSHHSEQLPGGPNFLGGTTLSIRHPDSPRTPINKGKLPPCRAGTPEMRIMNLSHSDQFDL